MDSIKERESDGCSYVKCPFPDNTGCDYMVIIKGYCTIGKYSTLDCVYAWLPKNDKAEHAVR